jgi:hypothetical protein
VTYPEEDTIGIEGVCPHLGLADDYESHATYATEAHRCYKLPTPTRIAANHQETYCLGVNHRTCPVFQGEGIARTQTTAAPTRPGRAPAAGAAAGATAAAGAAAGGGGPQPRSSSAAFGRPGGGPAGRPGSAPGGRRPPAGPRPRPGGISMPVATIGLLGLAVVVIAVAFLVQRAVGDDDDSLTPAERFETQDALRKTQQAGAGGTTVPVTQPPGTTTPGAPRTPGTPGTATTPGGTTAPGSTGTPGAGGRTTRSCRATPAAGSQPRTTSRSTRSWPRTT